MTFKDFKRKALAIYSERFTGGSLDPIEFAIGRASFEEAKLKRLIGLAEKTDFLTAKRKIEGWRRLLLKIEQTKIRLESRRNEVSPFPRFGYHPALTNLPSESLQRKGRELAVGQ